jgi:hypothetical protein
MLRHAHFYMKGGNRTFAALCSKVCCAEKNVHSLQAIQWPLLIGRIRDEKHLKPEPNICIDMEKPTSKRPKYSTVLSGLVRKA